MESPTWIKVFMVDLDAKLLTKKLIQMSIFDLS